MGDSWGWRIATYPWIKDFASAFGALATVVMPFLVFIACESLGLMHMHFSGCCCMSDWLLLIVLSLKLSQSINQSIDQKEGGDE